MLLHKRSALCLKIFSGSPTHCCWELKRLVVFRNMISMNTEFHPLYLLEEYEYFRLQYLYIYIFFFSRLEF